MDQNIWSKYVKICADARDCQGPNGCPALEIPSGVHLRVSVHSVPMFTDVYRVSR